jgi:hypothetical protein
LDITLLAVDDSGRHVGTGRPEFNFHFRYRDISFSVRFRDEGTQARLDLSAWLGNFPYSAESAVQRQALAAILRSVNQELGPILSLSHGKIALHTALPMPVPVTAVGLVSALTHFLVPLKPYLDLMAMVRMMQPAKGH